MWLLPTILMTAAAAVYAAVRPDTWRASQALVVRDETQGSQARQGRFESFDEMKSFQETVTEVARSRRVAEAALRELGPTEQPRNQAWPTPADIEKLQERITVKAPKGAEFGRTEVIYLSVTAAEREEAIARTKAVCNQLEKHLGDLRDARAASVVAELEKSLELSKSDLDKASRRLQQIEARIGGDLGELQTLNHTGPGDSNLRMSLSGLETELRQTRSKMQAHLQLHELLAKAKENPDELLATPASLLESQPALQRLKEGLVDAQLHTSSLLGKWNRGHPAVLAAVRAEQEVRQNIHHELATALRGVEADLQVSRKRLESLEQQRREAKQRLDQLASLRAQYSNLVDTVQQQTEIVQNDKRALAEARAAKTAARSTSLLTRFHGPQIGDQPVGPGRAAIVVAGMLGGLAAGIGLVFLAVPCAPARGRRWTDYLPARPGVGTLMFGRRASDAAITQQLEHRPTTATRLADDQPVITGRRATDAPYGRRAHDAPDVPKIDRRRSPRRAEDRDRPE